MGFTNIRYPSELLRNAGDEHFTSAILPEFNKLVNINGHFFEQEELDTFVDVLRHPLKDVWLCLNKPHGLVAGQADAPIDRPSVRTSSGLKRDHRPPVRRSDEPEDTTPKPQLAFVLVIRGKSAALCSKVLIFYTLNAAAAAMFEEAVNGYSTVFSAAILKAKVGKLGYSTRKFVKVDTITQLYKSGEDDDGNVAMLCGGERYGGVENI